MTKVTKWVVGAAAAALVLGGAYLAMPASRASAASYPWGVMMGGNPSAIAQRFGGQHVAMMASFQGDWNAIRQAMVKAAPQMAGLHQNAVSALSNKLGLTPEQLQAELSKGRTIAELAKAKGVEPSEIKSLATNQAQSMHNALVQSGVLTQTQADQMNAMMNNANLDLMLDTNMSGMMSGFPGGSTGGLGGGMMGGISR